VELSGLDASFLDLIPFDDDVRDYEDLRSRIYSEVEKKHDEQING